MLMYEHNNLSETSFVLLSSYCIKPTKETKKVEKTLKKEKRLAMTINVPIKAQ